MITSKVVPRLLLLRQRATCTLQSHGGIFSGRVQPFLPAYYSLPKHERRTYSTAADNRPPPRWIQLEPELEEALVPRKLSVSPLESWLSLRYSLPPLQGTAQPLEEGVLEEKKVLPSASVSGFEDGEDSVTPLRCKNVLEIRRRKMNRHKYKRLLKRTKFIRRRVEIGRVKRKQNIFENKLKRIWTRAGLKSPVSWNIPKIYIKGQRNKMG
ncbi:small ribosomal subunit protein mS38 isoform 1-T2 [Aulostomus maculatus]